jgi:hypothetical protein
LVKEWSLSGAQTGLWSGVPSWTSVAANASSIGCIPESRAVAFNTLLSSYVIVRIVGSTSALKVSSIKGETFRAADAFLRWRVPMEVSWAAFACFGSCVPEVGFIASNTSGCGINVRSWSRADTSEGVSVKDISAGAIEAGPGIGIPVSRLIASNTFIVAIKVGCWGGADAFVVNCISNESSWASNTV